MISIIYTSNHIQISSEILGQLELNGWTKRKIPEVSQQQQTCQLWFLLELDANLKALPVIPHSANNINHEILCHSYHECKMLLLCRGRKGFKEFQNKK